MPRDDVGGLMTYCECGHLEMRHEEPEAHASDRKWCHACENYCFVAKEPHMTDKADEIARDMAKEVATKIATGRYFIRNDMTAKDATIRAYTGLIYNALRSYRDEGLEEVAKVAQVSFIQGTIDEDAEALGERIAKTIRARKSGGKS